MLRGLFASLILHAGAGYVLVFGVPAIPLSLPDPDVFDVSLDLVDVADDAPILALAIEQSAAVPLQLSDIAPDDMAASAPIDGAAPEEEQEDQVPSEAEAEAEVEVPAEPVLAVDDDALSEDERLEVASGRTLEIEVESTVFDATQEATLGRGGEALLEPPVAEETQQREPTIEKPDAGSWAEQSVEDSISQDMVDAMTVSGGDADALADALETLTETVIEDTAPAPEPDLAEKVQEQFGDREEPEDTVDPVEPGLNSEGDNVGGNDLTPEASADGPIDEQAEDAFATMPVPKVRPTRRPTYIDTEALEDQDRIVSAARLVTDDPVDDLIAAAMEEAAVAEAQRAAEAAEAAEIARVAAARQADAMAEQAARDAANAAASRQINTNIEAAMDWPVFVRAQDQWKVAAKVELKDLSGNIASVNVRVVKAPSTASAQMINTVRNALEGAILSSAPWQIPTQYYDDWLDIPEFVLCPRTSVLTASSPC